MVTLLIKSFRGATCGKSRGSVFLYCKYIHNQNNLRSNDGSLRKTFHKNEEVKKIRSYMLTRYLDYVQNYEKIIEKRFPTAMGLFRTFKIGMRQFYQDLLAYMRIIRNLNKTADGLKSLTLSEIEIYHKLPKDMFKVAPVLLLSALPFTNYIIFPLAYYFPRQLLCSHFWTIQQKSEFQVYYLRQRLSHQRPTFRCLQAELDSLKKHPLYEEWRDILGCIGSGVQPTTEQIIHCKDLFAGKPYTIENLHGHHLNHLLKMHGMHAMWFRRTRLREHAKLLRAMDRAIVREDGLKNLSQENLKYACFIRGLSPQNLQKEEMIEWLKQWLEISQVIEYDNLSLLLHSPILLGYNHPNNWLLIY